VITPIGRNRYDPTLTKLLPERFAIVPFIDSQAFRAPSSFANFDAIERFEDFTLVVPVGFAQSKVERITVGVDDQVAFEAVNTVFS
jgi:hypothetical protein